MKFLHLKKLISILIKFELLLGLCQIIFMSNLFAKNIQKSVKTRISSDIIDIKKKTQTIDFINNVIVEREDVSLLAKKMTIFYYDNKTTKEASKSWIKEIKAYNNIRLFNNEFTANADLASFDPDKNIIILEKNVTVNNGTSVINSEKFIYNLDNKKGQIYGNSQENYQIINGSKVKDNRVTIIIGDDIKDSPINIKK